jgi:transcription antitermination factor NusG
MSLKTKISELIPGDCVKLDFSPFKDQLGIVLKIYNHKIFFLWTDGEITMSTFYFQGQSLLVNLNLKHVEF